MINRAAARLFPLVPHSVASHFASRYIGGTSLADAVAVATSLQNLRLSVTLDVLGEAVVNQRAADLYASQYLDAISGLEAAGIQPHVSVKPSALGGLLGWSECEERVIRIAERARSSDGLVCLDMEWEHTVGDTIALYRRLIERGFDNVTMVLQARLLRTLGDVQGLVALRPHVRICKGIYPEPAEVAHTAPDAIRASYVACLDVLLGTGSYVGIATHDENLIASSLALIRKHGSPQASYEFQMLLGVRQDLAQQLAEEGHRVRIYIPYGADWYAYVQRRFAESPHVLGYVTRALVRDMFSSRRNRA